MNKEERREQKALAKEIKAANRSLSYLSKEKQTEFGISAVQMEDNVFFCGSNLYKKIYMFHPASLGKRRTAFIKALTDRYNNRIRFSICTRNLKGKLTAYMFMTVTFEEENYYEAKKKIRLFEESLINEVCNFLGISISPCSVENVLTYIWMNYSGEMKKISSDVLFSRTGKFFDSINRFGQVMIGKNYPDTTERANEFMTLHEGSYYIVVDLQGYTEDEQHIFDYGIKNRFGLYNEVEKAHFINMTYLLSVVGKDEEELKSLTEDAYRFYDGIGIQLMPGVGREKEILLSSCSLGLVDFRSMQNASEEIIGGLLL